LKGFVKFRFLNINKSIISNIFKDTLVMKHPVPLLIATLFVFLLGTSYLRNITCPCGIAPPTSEASISTATTLSAAVPMAVNFVEPKAVEAVATPAAAPKADAARIEAIGQRLRAKELVLYFDTDQPTTSLSETQRKELEDIQFYLAQNPNSNVKVVGHTDSRGSASYNEKLSASRANFVADYLKTLGTNDQKFTARGDGEEAPASTNETAKGRAKNRRVVVSLS
jgi:outer membrane protein OmpA-like peptidoglycan-associated protein